MEPFDKLGRPPVKPAWHRGLLPVMAALVCLTGSRVSASQTEARLMLAAETAKPGERVLAAIRFRIAPGWHIYWRNPGGTGMATSAEWEVPAGVTPGALQWPAPRKLPEDDLTTYIYEREVTLVVPIQLAADLKPGPLELKAKVSWLECKAECQPGDGEIKATLTIAGESKPSKDAPAIETAQKRLPQPMAAAGVRAWWEKPATGKTRPLILEWTASGTGSEPDFFPDTGDKFEVQPATERIEVGGGKVRVRKIVKLTGGDWPAAVSGVLYQKGDPQPVAYEGSIPVAGVGPEPTGGSAVPAAGEKANSSPPPAATPEPAEESQSLALMLVYAFIGGLILNIMPCVLPVIALKILSFVGQARQEPRRVRMLGLVYAAGVMVSFLAFGGVVVGLKLAGQAAGWGFQFSDPRFVVGLTVVVTLVALNLFGLFEVNAGSQVLNAAGSAASQHGVAGAFFNGVLATVLSTPCSAPFMGVALGFAFSQSPAVILLLLATVGLGLAAPYVVLSWNPAWLKVLPKPGAWMERFKVAMGFPMLATAMWLFSLLPVFYGPRSWWLGMFLVIVALAAWIYGQFVQRGQSRRALGLAVAVALLLAGYFVIVEGELDWRNLVDEKTAGGVVKDGAEGIEWQPWNLAAIEEARQAGRPVLVDFTADWCLTCQLNKRAALEVKSVRGKIKETQTLALIADYTRRPKAMTEELHRYHRAAVPMVLVYPKDPKKPATVLPAQLTSGIVLAALEKATR